MRSLPKRRVYETIIFAFLGIATLVVIVPVGVVTYYLISKGAGALSWEFLSSAPREGMRAGGIFPAILGTLILVIGTIIVALPLGLFAAIYLTEYAKAGPLIRLIRLTIINLAGVPSVVFGLFGLGVFVILCRFGSSILAGSLTLALLILPLIITASEEALLAVPWSFREASLALGVTKWQTIRHTVLPNALPGIITGAVLGIARAAGETAPILFTCAAFFLPRLPHSPFDQVMALPYHLYVICTQVPNVPIKNQYGTALVLLGLVLCVDLIAIIIRARLRRIRKW